jgi:Recombination endonuclease VII
MESTENCMCTPECTVPYGTCHCGCGQSTPLAAQTRVAFGHVKGKPVQFVKGHAGRKPVHELTGIDERMHTAICGKCGPVTVRVHSRNSRDEINWRCMGRLITEHAISEIDESTRTAFCRGCGQTVSIIKNPARTKGWVCGVKLRNDQRDYRAGNPEKISVGHKAWRDANPGRIRDYQLQRLYGISIEEYAAETAKREGRCDVCHEIPDGNGPNGTSLCVEHNHVTGEIRGYADRDCNVMIGGAHDDPVRLAMGIVYLKPTLEQLRDITRILYGYSGPMQGHKLL